MIIDVNNIPPKPPKLTPSNFGRKVHEFVMKILCNIWRTSWSYFRTIQLDADLRERVQKYRFRRDTDIYTKQAVEELRHKSVVGPSSVHAYCENVLPKDPKIQYSPRFMLEGNVKQLPQLEDGKDLLFIPVVLKSSTRDHIVAVVYDRINNISCGPFRATLI